MSQDLTKIKLACPSCQHKFFVAQQEPLSPCECPHCHKHLRIPLPFGSLLINKKISDKAHFSVYRAYDPALHRDLNLFLLNPSLAHHKKIKKNLSHYSSKMAQISHPKIAPLFGCGEEKEQYYITCRHYKNSESLATLLEAKTEIPLKKKIFFLQEICQTLRYAIKHHLQVQSIGLEQVHLLSDGSVVLSDLGLNELFYQDLAFASLYEDRQLAPEISPEKPNSSRAIFYSLGQIFDLLLKNDHELAKHQQAQIEMSKMTDKLLEANPQERLSDFPQVLNMLHFLQKHLLENNEEKRDDLRYILNAFTSLFLLITCIFLSARVFPDNDIARNVKSFKEKVINIFSKD